MQQIGHSKIRVDAREKISGSALYLADYDVGDCLQGFTVRSQRAHATIKQIVFDADFDWSRLTVVQAADIPGRNVNPVILEDQPFLADRVVRYYGEPILLLAAPTLELCRAAADHISISYEELPACFTIEESLATSTPFFGEDNSFKRLQINKGDIEAAFREQNFHITEAEYTTAAQEQLYLEPQAMLAQFDLEGGLLVTGSLQCPFYVHSSLASAFPELVDRIEVRQSVTGGAFGGKEDFPSLIATHAALLAYHSGRSVRMLYDRAEDFQCTTKRHPSRTRIRSAVDTEGNIVALDVELLLNAGAYSTLSQVVLARGVLHAAGAYHVPHVRVQGNALATNLPPSGAFRGFGAPQAIFAIESHLDKIAQELNQDPVVLRRRNLLRPGDTFSTGQLVQTDACSQVLERAVSSSAYEENNRADRVFNDSHPTLRRGTGLALFYHGAGFTGSGENRIQGCALLQGNVDGTISIRVTSTEMGQGAATVLAQIAAEALQVSTAMIRFETPTTQHPDSGPTVASRTTMIVGKLIERAASELRERIAEYSGDEQFRTRVSQAVAAGGLETLSSYEPPPELKWDEETYQGDAYPDYSWGCYLAQVEVSLLDYSVRIRRFTTVQDIGTVINPALAAGQVEGGIMQAIGFTLYEKVHYADGKTLNAGFTDYIIPTLADLPQLAVEFIEYPSDRGGYGAKGVGELPFDGVAPAIAAAIRAAVGVDVRHLPLLPEQLMELLCQV
ncbi:MAG: xanthine dehydrogenase family protein [Candidatus Delongbacteria bacterium]|nr:xanthine dehydrogenase family protein [Candidatus Delongbacteria bacterium]